MYQTRNAWVAIFRPNGGPTERVDVEAWDENGEAMIVDPKVAQLVRASRQSGFVELTKTRPWGPWA